MEINQIISLAHHCLHLCNNSNIEEIVFSYVMDADVFVTTDSEFWEKKFKEHQIDCRIKRPGVVKPEERIVVDSSSLGEDFELWEKKWKKQAQVVCIYNIDTLNPAKIKGLVETHDRMIISVNNVKMLSDKNLEKEIDNLNPEMVDNLVKKELKNILVSMLLTNPMCGTDLVKMLYQKFKVFISPGTLYPTLHELEKEGLLKYEYQLKSKVYSIKEKEQAEVLLKKHVNANYLLSEILIRT
ncbi:MAG: PadR family transcriptional regulator [Nanoarchaeota archaeon]